MFDANGKLIVIGKQAYIGIRKGLLIDDVCLDYRGGGHPVYRYTIVLPNGRFVRASAKYVRMVEETN